MLFRTPRAFCAVLLGFCTLFVCETLAQVSSSITAVWANDGEDKVTQDELRASTGHAVTNSLWDGTTIKLFGAKNEVINFNLILEAASTSATNVSVTMSNLNGPSGSVIRYASRATSNLFDWTATESELFYIRYLQILGLSNFGYGAMATWQEPTFPQRAQCPSGTGCAWTTRPVANKFYPDIAVPIELAPNFTIAAGNNQSIWADIYIPKTAAVGSYSGTVTISENGVATHTVPISLTVRNFMLPDVPSSKTMLATSYGDISHRYTGVQFPNTGTAQDLLTKQVLQTQLSVAHRHKISLIDDNFGQGWSSLQPASQWLPFLSGTAFTSSNGYVGPGAGTGQDVFSIGTYGGMTDNSSETQSAFTAQFNGWESWFEANFPSKDRFVYLCDEINCLNNTPTLATQLQWWQAISGVGHNLHTLATQPLKDVVGAALSNPTSSWPYSSQASSSDQANANTILAAGPARKLYAYGGTRPGSGSMIIEDEGTSMRELPWGQYKKQVDRWFIWEATYYNDYQSCSGNNCRGNNNLFTTADTFGETSANSMYGQVGGSNGSGVLFYPGTDAVFSANSYGISGPIVGLRLKHWRRGIQDVDYLTLANAINPTAVANLVNSMVPNALWENQCHDLTDCSYFIGPVSWSNNPDQWENARAQLADIIDGSTPGQISIVSAMTISLASPTVSQTTTAAFTVQNTGGQAISVQYFLVGARDPSNANVDFPASSPITLQPGQQYTYQASQAFTKAGTYMAWPAYFDGSTWIELASHTNFTVQNMLTVVALLTLSPVLPVVNQPLTAAFTVKNTSSQAVSVQYFFAAARSPSDTNADFPASPPLTLQPGQQYSYQASQTYTTAGTYTTRPAYFDGTNWIDLAPPARFSVSSTVVRTEQNDPSVVLGPNQWSWTTGNTSLASGGSYISTSVAGSTLQFAFNGVGVSIIGIVDSCGGQGTLNIDGVAQTIDYYKATGGGYQQVAFSVTALPSGTHTLTLTALGTKQPASCGAWVNVDAFDVQR